MTWTAPTVERSPSPKLVDERAALQGWLDFHRETLLWKCQGLTHAQLAMRAIPPSRLSLLGLVRHMAEVEAWWFRTHVVGQPSHGFFGLQDEDDFENLDSVPAEEAFATYADQCRLADAAVADVPLEQTFPAPWGNGDLDLRWVYIHMIEEYARHNGHADLIRELVDGVTGD